MAVNRVFLLGHLGQDPKIRNYDAGQIASFTLATSEQYKGEKTTEWHYINLFGKTAEIASKYLKKGSMVFIEGKIHYDSWDKEDGSKGYRTVINGRSLQMLGNTKKVESGKCQTDEGKSDDLPF